MSKNEDKEDKKANWLYYTLAVLSLLFFLVTIFWYLNFKSEIKSVGDIGGFVGGIAGSLFSCLAFIGVLWTNKLQRDELDAANSARDYAKAQAEKQIQLVKTQQFENTFFSLLSNHEVALKRIITESENRTSIADEALSDIGRDHFQCAKSEFNFYGYKEITSYFIVLYQLLKFVDESKAIELHVKKKKYISLLRAYLPNNVLMLILYNCYVDLTSNDKSNKFQKYKRLIEKYAFLEHIAWSFDIWPNGTSCNQNNFNFRPSELDVFFSNNHRFLIFDSYNYNNSAFGENLYLIEKDFFPELAVSFLEAFVRLSEEIKRMHQEQDKIREDINELESKKAFLENLDKDLKITGDLLNVKSENPDQYFGKVRELENMCIAHNLNNTDIFPLYDWYQFNRYQPNERKKLLSEATLNPLKEKLKKLRGFLLSVKNDYDNKNTNRDIKKLENKYNSISVNVRDLLVKKIKNLDGDLNLNNEGILFFEVRKFVNSKSENEISDIVKKQIP